MMKAKNISPLMLCGLVALTGCSFFDRHPDSGYGESTRGSRRGQISRKSTDSGSHGTTSFSSDKGRLQSLENSLSTRKEIEQYSKLLPWFESEQERIEFLQQGSYEQKQTWLNQKSFLSRPQKIDDDMKELVEAQDITVGMPQSLVKRSWGEPDVVEVSGNPQFRNERWRYNRYVSTSDGYKAEKKAVYFEGGKVVGWEVE